MAPPEKAASRPDGGQKPAAPSISLPKGGGAIRGIGEKFAANPVTGTGSMSVPIAASPGRSGFGPQLSLSYDSGAGNGPFGFGWHLSIPAITRKTDKGLPRYEDAAESDVFVLSGAEDLVPVLVTNNGTSQREAVDPRTVNGQTYVIQRYRPRIEGLFARIERWSNTSDSTDTFWRSISKDNITTWYGRTEESRIADPADRRRIFSWLICESYDDKGNVMVYGYKPEDSDNVPASLVHERNRTPKSRSVNRYLKRVRYGNNVPYRPELSAAEPWPAPPGATALDGSRDWVFELVLDYGEHDPAVPVPQDTATAWICRNDPFSTYRATFEVRSYRLCQRVLMFHHFPGEPGVGNDCLVRSTGFTYSYEEAPADPRNPIYSFLLSATQTGYVRQSGAYRSQSLPPIEFEYTQPTVDETVREIDAESLENLPYGLDGSRYQWVDLDGEGLSGILTEQAGGWFYKRNLSPASVQTVNGSETPVARFAPLERVARQPSLAALGASRQQLLDLAGDGQLDLVEFQGRTPGFYERTEDDDWEPFAAFTSLPNLDWGSPNLKFVDLTGDGHADVLISHDDAFCWHASLAEAGFGPEQRVSQAVDEEKGPRLLFADSTQSTFLADLSGDGLTDLVRIRNGEVCYWPNLGYGRFGAKVTMDDAPWFEEAEIYDGRRLRLADIDGTGTTDIIYFASEGVQLYFNQSGNGWSERRVLDHYPPVDSVSSATALDLLGNGTACLVWSSSLANHTRRPMRYIDLMGGQKPHLLVREFNNLGAETRVSYAPSTKFYTADRLAGTPWMTRIPFPVHVVERVETYDWISRNRFVTRYAYHHGYYDGIEREFRGFGMVEQWDTEELAALGVSDAFPAATNLDEASHVPPIYTKTWFHTGASLGEERISKQFEEEYYREGDASEGEPGLTDSQLEAMLLEDTVLPDTLRLSDGARIPYRLSSEETREACRALKGSTLRLEVYGLDGTDEADRPFSVSERNYTIEVLQPRGDNPFAVFFAHARETVDFHYERQLYDVAGVALADPRVSHAVTLAVDPYGNVLKSVAIGYGRRHPDADLSAPDRAKQTRTLLTSTENRFTDPILRDDAYRTPLPCESRTYELLGLAPASTQPLVTNLFRFNDLLGETEAAGDGHHDVPYEDIRGVGTQASHPWRRLIEHVRTLYRRDDLTGPLPLGQCHPLALPYEGYKLAFTRGLLSQVFGARVTDPILADEGGYVHSEAEPDWWIPSGQVFYSENKNDTAAEELAFARSHFYLPHRFRDPFGNSTTVGYGVHDLLVQRTTDALTNTASAEHDYRVLAPFRMTDPNGNRSQVAFDALGLVAGTAVMGMITENLGDSLADFIPDLTTPEIDDFLTAPDPHVSAPNLLRGATTRIIYDVDRFRATRDANPDDPARWQPVFAATLARETHLSDLLPGQQSKIQISFSHSDGFGREIQKKIQAEPGALIPDGPVASPRWVGSGWTIFNNKGKPVRQYEPFFDDTHDFRFGNRVGVSPILFYDPAERVVATLHPNHTWEKVVFDPWQLTTYDVNDTVLNADGSTDPKSDEDVKGFFSRLPDADYLPTWYERRSALPANDPERVAADKTAVHRQTPTVAHLDTLGRTFLTIAYNRFERNSAIVEEKYPSRVELDIEGNQRDVRDAVVQDGDALGRIVMRYDYDLLGNRIHHASMEAGERWMLNDVTGKPIRAWDSRGFTRRITYDELRRPTGLFVTGNAVERLAERTVYGESQGVTNNHLTRVFQVFDGAGVVTSEAYDFKGNLRRSRRDLLPDYTREVDWEQDPTPNDGTFTSSTTYDALDRPTSVSAPDNSTYRPTYNEANFLDKVDVNLRGTTANDEPVWTPFVTNIDYDAKGQRTLIRYANGAETISEYDEQTFRLIHLETTRAPSQNGLASQIFKNAATVQDLRYTYDPAGNITRIEDAALLTIFHNGQQVEPLCDYTYDAIYRLIEVSGREHIGQATFDFAPPNGNFRDYPFAGAHANPNDLQALRNYTEQYQYDASGNFEKQIHQAANGNWTRAYAYDEPSLVESTKQSNRLSSSTVGEMTEAYGHDAHGNMTAMPHLSVMGWDFKDQLRATSAQAINNGTPETTFYVYDASGQRVRKVTERQNGTRKDERIYLGGFEIYREYDSSAAAMTLERETLHVMDDKQRMALVETRTLGSDGSPAQLTRHQFDNHLRSASLELDEAGRIISYEEYYPYGSTSYQAGRSAAEARLKRYRYTGKERDEETGFTYHGARYHAPWLGRWASADPLGIEGGLNLFAYAALNPIALLDSDGRQPTGTREEIPIPDNAAEEYGDPDLPGVVSGYQDKVGNRWIWNDEEQSFEQLVWGPKSRQLEGPTADVARGCGPTPAETEASFAQSIRTLERANSNPIITALSLPTIVRTDGDPIEVNRAFDAYAGPVGVLEALGGTPMPGRRPEVPTTAPNAPMGASGPPGSSGVTAHPDIPLSSLPTAPGRKVVASTPGGPTALSGWGEGSSIPGLGIPAVTAYEYSQRHGIPQPPHFFDVPGAPGSYGASHAEWQAYVLNPEPRSVTVSKRPCLGCETRFRAEASRLEAPIRINAPSEAGPGTWRFAPSGTMWVAPFVGAYFRPH